MRRRALLTTLAPTLTIATAGCQDTNPEPDDPTATTASPSQTPTASPTDEPAQPDVRVERVNAPETIEINTEWTWTITFRNDGDAPGTPDTITIQDADGNTLDKMTPSEPVPPQDTRQYTIDMNAIQYITSLTAAYGETDVVTVQTVSRALTWGDVYSSPQNITATVTTIEFKNEYTYESTYSGTETRAAGEGRQWAFVTVEVANESGSQEFIPLVTDFGLRSDDRQWDAQFIRKEDGKYEGGEVGPGVVRSGWICYNVPDTYSPADMTVEWFDSTVEGDYGVRWTYK